MKFLKRPQLVLVLSAFVTMFCRCAFDGGTPVTLILADGSTLECHEFYESNPTWDTTFYYYTYDCSIPCPDGSSVTAKEMRLPNIEGKYNGVDIVDTDLTTLQAKYCVAATPTATPTPLAEDPAAAVQIAAPLLTERITACNYKAGFVNFELADPSALYDDTQTLVTLNDTQTECSVPNNNTDILTCGLPAGIRFPIAVKAQTDGAEVNNFVFDGSFCGYKDPTGSEDGQEGSGDAGSPGSPGVVPTATDFGG